MKGLYKTDIAEFITAGIEQIAEAAVIGLHANAVCDELVSHENQRCMGDQCVKVPALDFLRKVQVLFGHLEQNFDIPAFAVDSNDILIGQVDIGRQKCQPVCFSAVANEHDLCRRLIFESDDSGGQNPGTPRPFAQLLMDRCKIPFMPIMFVVDLGRFLSMPITSRYFRRAAIFDGMVNHLSMST